MRERYDDQYSEDFELQLPLSKGQMLPINRLKKCGARDRHLSLGLLGKQTGPAPTMIIQPLRCGVKSPATHHRSERVARTTLPPPPRPASNKSTSSSMDASSALTALPDECALHILKFLAVGDIIAVAACCTGGLVDPRAR